MTELVNAIYDLAICVSVTILVQTIVILICAGIVCRLLDR